MWCRLELLQGSLLLWLFLLRFLFQFVVSQGGLDGVLRQHCKSWKGRRFRLQAPGGDRQVTVYVYVYLEYACTCLYCAGQGTTWGVGLEADSGLVAGVALEPRPGLGVVLRKRTV